ncbi:MAG: hypothetical protein IPG72_00050 [Ardenticatenales bacterium]|nr:hypothetical protein [Ardenticatenales bacterium]
MTDVLISIEIACASGDGVIRLNGSSVGGTGVTVGGSDRQPATASVGPSETVASVSETKRDRSRVPVS